MTVQAVRLIAAVGFWSVVGTTARAEESNTAALAVAMKNATATLQRGLTISKAQGTPISAKFEIENGKLQLKIYTMKDYDFKEVVADPKTGAITRELGFPEDAKPWPISRLSTGERLRLALVRVLMVRPKILLLDEPTAALDPASVAAVEALIATRVQSGLAVLWITHDAEQARHIAHRLLVVKGGQVREEVPEWQATSP